MSLTTKNLEVATVFTYSWKLAYQPIRGWVLPQLFCKYNTNHYWHFENIALTHIWDNLSSEAKRKANICESCSLYFSLPLPLFLLFIIGNVGTNKNQQVLLSTSIILLHYSWEIHLLNIRLTGVTFLKWTIYCILISIDVFNAPHLLRYIVRLSHFCLKRVKINQICV